MNPKMTFSPANQVQPTYYPDPRTNRPPDPYYNSGPMPPQMTPSSAHHVRSIYTPDPRMYQRPQNSYYSSPAHHVRPPYSPDPRMYQQQPRGSCYNSGPRNPSTMPPYSSFPPHGQSGKFQAQDLSRKPYVNARNPSFRGQRPIACSGYGQGGKTGGSCSQETVLAKIRPNRYYNKSMVEDPWKDLKPKLWKVGVSYVKKKPNYFFGAATSSHSDSIRTKKPRVLEASGESSSQPSLAELLAAAYNEAVGEKGDNVSTPDSRTLSLPDSFGTEKPRVLEASGESSSQPIPSEYLAASLNETVGEKDDSQGSSL